MKPIKHIHQRAVWMLVLCGWATLIHSALAGPPPVITMQPTNQTVQTGGTAVFAVAATSGTALSYQWYFDSAQIPGATSSTLSRTNAQPAHAGPYYVAVMNADGTVNSAVATLTIKNAPVLSGANNLSAIAENDFSNAGTLVTNLIAGHVTDADPGALQGIAVTAVNTNNGAWQYSTNGGANWLAFGTPSETAARLLPANATTYVRFVPNTNWDGVVTNGITFRAWDQTAGVAGGTAVVGSSGTMLDTFSASAYSNNDGTHPWNGNWIDSGEFASGNITIGSGTLEVRANVTNTWIYRRANLSAVSSAIVSFNYNNDLISAVASGRVDFQVSSNGGANYTTLAAFSATNNYGVGSFSADITPFATSNTAIRFLVTGRSVPTKQVNFDNVQIAFSVNYGGGTTAFSSATAGSSIAVNAPSADVIASLSGPNTIAPLTNFTYTVTVSNQGPSTASNVVVSAQLSDKVTFISASHGGSYLAAVVTWPSLASLPVGAVTNFTVTVKSPPKGSLTNTATSTSATADPDTSNNNGSASSARVITTVTPIKVDSTSSGASVTTLTWSHTISPGSARILVVGISIDSPTANVIAATFANLLPLTPLGQTNSSQTKVVMYYLLNPPVGTFPISVNLSATAGIVGGAVSFSGVDQSNPIAAFSANSGNSNVANVTVAGALGGVIIDIVAPKSPAQAQSASTERTIAWNRSSAGYSGAGGSMPGGPSITPSWTFAGQSAWALGAVALNPAAVLSDIAVTVSGPSNAVAGSNLTYTITVTNGGPDSATNLVTHDALPAGATLISASGGGTLNGGILTWPGVSNFVAGATTNYMVSVSVPGSGPLTNIVYSTASTADPDAANNNGTSLANQVITTVDPRVNVAALLSGPAHAFASTPFSYTVTVTNAGPSAASNVVIMDSLPVGATFISASDNGVHDAGTVTWPVLGSLDSGAATSVVVTVAAVSPGMLTNVASSSTATVDTNPSNNDGSAAASRVMTQIYPLPVLTGQWTPAHAYQFAFSTIPNINVSIEASTNLSDWQVLATVNSTNGWIDFTDFDATNHPHRFYRSTQTP